VAIEKNSVADPGCLSRIRFFPSRILDPNFSIPVPGSAYKNLSILTPKNGFYALGNMIGLFIPDPDPNFTHPGSRGQKGTGSRIWIRNTGKKYVLLIYVDTKS
jgi:hypothetical protein